MFNDKDDMKTWIAKFSLTALTAAALLLPNAPTYAGSSKLYVDDDKQQCKTAQFSKVQDAIDAAKPSDTIFVCSGSYAEHLTITKKLTLRSQVSSGQAVPVLANEETNTRTITVLNVRDVTIRDLSFSGNMNNIGIFGDNADRLTLQSLTMSTFGTAIFVRQGSDGSVITKNNLTNNAFGIRVKESAKVKVTSNNIEGNSVSGLEGIGIESSAQSELSNNRTFDLDTGVGLSETTGAKLTSNEEIASKTGILLNRSSDATVTSNLVRSSVIGFRLLGSTNNTITGSTSNLNGVNIDLDAESTGNTIKDYTAQNSNIDLRDKSKGTKTAGTANTWSHITCRSSDPQELCKAAQ